MKSIILLITLAFALPLFAKSEVDSIIRVSSTLQEHSFGQPWQKGSPYKRRGLGVLVGKNQVLTTAEMVADANFIQLETVDGIHKLTAKAIAVDYESNLALLSVISDEDKAIISKLPAAELNKPSKLGEQVQIVQVEDNGMPIITNGVFRTSDMISTFADGHFFLSYEIKASLQSSSHSYTIPVFKDKKLLGLLTSYDSEDQILNSIAPEIIASFLADAKDGTYAGFPALGIGIKRTTDPHFRSWLKLDAEKGGVFISRIDRNSSAQKAGVKVGDVLLKLDDHPLDRRGYYPDDNYRQLYWRHLVRGSKKIHDSIKITLLRDGKTIELNAKLERPVEGIIPSHMYGRAPRYLIKGGIIFTELSLPYLQLYGESWESRAPITLLDAYNNPGDYEKGRKRLVIISRIHPTRATQGYEGIRDDIVNKVNGVKIADIPSLIKAFENADKQGIHTIDIDSSPKKLYLDEAASNEADKGLKELNIPLSRK